MFFVHSTSAILKTNNSFSFEKIFFFVPFGWLPLAVSRQLNKLFIIQGAKIYSREKKMGFHASLFRRHPIQWVFCSFLGKNKFSGICIGNMRAVRHSFCQKSSCLGCEHEKVCISISHSRTDRLPHSFSYNFFSGKCFSCYLLKQ